MSRHISMLFTSLLVFLQPSVYGQVINVTTQDDFGNLLDDNTLVVAKFVTQWCGACKAVEESFASLSQDPENKNVVFIQVDINTVETLKNRYNISYIPHFIFFKDGKIVKQKLFESLDTFHQSMMQELQDLQSDTAPETLSQKDAAAPPEKPTVPQKNLLARLSEFIMIPITFIMHVLERLFATIKSWFE